MFCALQEAVVSNENTRALRKITIVFTDATAARLSHYRKKHARKARSRASVFGGKCLRRVVFILRYFDNASKSASLKSILAASRFSCR